MDEEEKKKNAKRNLHRVQLKIGEELYNNVTKKQLENLKNYKLFYGGKPIKLDRIDFNNTLIFICEDSDFSCIIPYYGLLRINNVSVPDYSYEGAHSNVDTDFMVISSREVRFSQIPQTNFYNYARDGDMPESLNTIMFKKRKLCIWRLASTVGMGDNEKMYNTCYTLVDDRYKSGKLDWLFYTGTVLDFQNEYRELAKLGFPIYIISKKEVKERDGGLF